MVARFFFVLCVQALFIQQSLTQYIRGPPYPYDGYSCGCNGIASTGGYFPVTSVSPISPTGLTIVSEAVFEGPLIVGGAAPFLSAVALEGLVPTTGIGAVSYGCGNTVGITSENPVLTGIVGPGAYAPASYGLGVPAPGLVGPGMAGPYGPGLGYPGCGYAF